MTWEESEEGGVPTSPHSLPPSTMSVYSLAPPDHKEIEHVLTEHVLTIRVDVFFKVFVVATVALTTIHAIELVTYWYKGGDS